MRFPLAALLALFVPMAWAEPAALAQDSAIAFETGRVVIETSDGASHEFAVELATTPEQQQRGLMFRRELAAEAGMLFLYDRVRVVSMWMRNTVIPLDMIFIAEDGRVEKVVERTVPMSLRTISSGRPVSAVLELNGGTAARLGLAVGDRVLHEAFGEGSRY